MSNLAYHMVVSHCDYEEDNLVPARLKEGEDEANLQMVGSAIVLREREPWSFYKL